MWALAQDTLSNSDIDALADWLRTHPRLTQGSEVRRFEAEWSRWMGCRDSVFVSSGTTANFALVARAAARVSRAQPRIGVAAVTWSTNLAPSLLMGHQVRVFDIDPRTLGIDAQAVCASMRAGELDILFVTHLLGLNALTHEIVATAADCGVILLEDCCESHGARHGAAPEGGRVGTIGLGSTFSFYFGHHMSTIEGGMVCTNDESFGDDIRLMRAHGLARESRHFDRYAAEYREIDRRFLFLQPGLNFRSTDLNAWLGQRQLLELDARIDQRNQNMNAFLESAPSTLFRDFNTEGMSSFALPLIARSRAERIAIQECCDRLGLESRPVVAGNLLRQPMLRGYDVLAPPGGTSVADHIHDCGLYVGNGHHVTPDMVRSFTAELCAALGVQPPATPAGERPA